MAQKPGVDARLLPPGLRTSFKNKKASKQPLKLSQYDLDVGHFSNSALPEHVEAVDTEGGVQNNLVQELLWQVVSGFHVI